MASLGYLLLAVGAAFILGAIGQGHLPYHDLAAVMLVPGVSLKGRPIAKRRRRRTYLSDFAMRC